MMWVHARRSAIHACLRRAYTCELSAVRPGLVRCSTLQVSGLWPACRSSWGIHHVSLRPSARVVFRWVGVLSSYILRPSAASLERLAAYRRDHSWASPVIGVHIRRTDKVTSGEAILHSVGEYMLHVERYCDWRHGSGWQQAQTAASKESETGTDDAVRLRRLPDSGRCTVYLATDEPEVVQETVKDYPHIQVITNLLSLATGRSWLGRCLSEGRDTAFTMPVHVFCQGARPDSMRTTVLSCTPPAVRCALQPA